MTNSEAYEKWKKEMIAKERPQDTDCKVGDILKGEDFYFNLVDKTVAELTASEAAFVLAYKSLQARSVLPMDLMHWRFKDGTTFPSMNGHRMGAFIEIQLSYPEGEEPPEQNRVNDLVEDMWDAVKRACYD